jgi:octaprenyl-diphosphate synthase
MDLEHIFAKIRSELAVVEQGLREISRSENPTISSTVSGILDAGGKRLRPALLLIAAGACNGSDRDPSCEESREHATRLGVVVELIHTASLIHDDVIDNAVMRRGIPTINSRWGNRTSILVGDHVYAKVMNILAEQGNLEIMRTVSDAACRMTESEAAQSLCRDRVDITEEEYLAIVAGKTASLMSCACRIGAMLGTVCNGEADILGDYGLNLGMAFQITDDVLDIVGDEDKEGKSLGNDIREGSLTLPFIHVLGRASSADRDWVVDVFRSREADRKTLSRMKDVATSYGGIEYSLGKVKGYGEACRKGLRMLEDSEYRGLLDGLTEYVVGRAG